MNCKADSGRSFSSTKSFKPVYYYEQNTSGRANSKQAQKGFESGKLAMEYIQGLNRALTVRFNYLDILNQHNQTIIEIEFISGVQ